MLDESTLKKDQSVTNALIYNDEFIVELLFIIVLPPTINEQLIVVPLFNVVIPETYNELSIKVLFCIVDPETFNDYW